MPDEENDNGTEDGGDKSFVLGKMFQAVKEYGLKSKALFFKVDEQSKRIFKNHEDIAALQGEVAELKRTVNGHPETGEPGMGKRMFRVEKRVYVLTAIIVVLVAYGPEAAKLLLKFLLPGG